MLPTSEPTLCRGQFVQIRPDHPNPRVAGKDAFITDVVLPEGIGLQFGYDRWGKHQGVVCVGTELWQPWELDLATITE